MTERSLTLPAPAKLNLMLHITGRRDDGYHNLQTIFQLLDFGDEITLVPLSNHAVQLDDTSMDIPLEDNLIYRAAMLLKASTGYSGGARIAITKHLPMGAGLGGGSSNAASTLVGLNELWQTRLSLAELANLGQSLGADVPVFVQGCSAWAEGIGEALTKVELPDRYYCVITPNCHVSTKEIFCHEELTRNTSPITIAAALGYGGKNDCEELVKRLYPEVKHVLEWLSQFANARLTGTGSSVFAGFHTRQEAQTALEQLPQQWRGFVARGVNVSPLHQVAKISTTL